jgi:hypothetical protein
MLVYVKTSENKYHGRYEHLKLWITVCNDLFTIKLRISGAISFITFVHPLNARNIQEVALHLFIALLLFPGLTADQEVYPEYVRMLAHADIQSSQLHGENKTS